MGLALGGRLLKACLDRGVEPQTEPPRRRADHGGRQGRRRRVRDPRGTQGGARAERGDRHRRLRAQRRPQARVPARAVHAHGRRRDERGRRPEDGHAGRRDAREHARGVVDADDRAADRHRAHRPAAADLRAHAARRDHGQPRGQALHQRGRQLQRVRRGVPRAGHDHGRLPQPAVLAGLRPDLARQVRLRRRSRRDREGPDGLDHVVRHGRGPGREARHRRRRARADHRALQRQRARPP